MIARLRRRPRAWLLVLSLGLVIAGSTVDASSASLGSAFVGAALAIWTGLLAELAWRKTRALTYRRLVAGVPAILAVLFALESIASAGQAVGLIAPQSSIAPTAAGAAQPSAAGAGPGETVAAATEASTTAPTAAPTQPPSAEPTAIARTSITEPPAPPPPARPIVTPAPPATAVSVVFTGLTSPVPHGADATASVRTAAGAACSITVIYKSGPSRAQGLVARTADGAGNVSWTWMVGTRTTPGSWPAIVTCSKGGMTGAATDYIVTT